MISEIHILSRTPTDVKSILGIIVATIAALRLEKAHHTCSTVKDLTNLAYSFSLNRLIIRPAQVKEEISMLLELLVKVPPRAILEIGTGGGGTLFLFSRVANPNAKLISVDLPSESVRGGYPEWKEPFYRSFALKRQKIMLVRADSHNPRTLEAVKKILSHEKLDFLFIDGDHSYEGVKRDFVLYAKLVNAGGMVAFHDIVPGPANKVGGVPEFWNEIKGKFRHEELVKDWQQRGFGIGIIYV
jgi:predicted O-methyltransferase YrrM